MTGDVAATDIWREIVSDEPWVAFTDRFGFAPDFHDRETPAIDVPDGALVVDYHVHARPDLGWGTFGHPWQQTLTIWGADLVSSLGDDLLTWLPRHRHSP